MDSEGFRRRLLSSGLVDSATICGCSALDISQIERIANRLLPIAYKDFMQTCGRSAGRFMQDVQFTYPTVVSLNRIAIEILNDRDQALQLPSGTFVFAGRNGEQFAFFTDQCDDPPVQLYMSGDSEFHAISPSFWSFVLTELEECESTYRKIKGTPYDLY